MDKRQASEIVSFCLIGGPSLARLQYYQAVKPQKEEVWISPSAGKVG